MLVHPLPIALSTFYIDNKVLHPSGTFNGSSGTLKNSVAMSFLLMLLLVTIVTHLSRRATT